MEKQGVAVLATIAAGGFIALQAPINAVLGRAVGSIAAASVSFAIGTAALVLITLLFAGGYGEVGEMRNLGLVYLTGGILGAIYVTTALIAVRTLGAGGVTAATITGQLLMSLLIDRFGLLGVTERPLSPQRVIGVALLAAGVYLVVRE